MLELGTSDINLILKIAYRAEECISELEGIRTIFNVAMRGGQCTTHPCSFSHACSLNAAAIDANITSEEAREQRTFGDCRILVQNDRVKTKKSASCPSLIFSPEKRISSVNFELSLFVFQQWQLIKLGFISCSSSSRRLTPNNGKSHWLICSSTVWIR